MNLDHDIVCVCANNECEYTFFSAFRADKEKQKGKKNYVFREFAIIVVTRLLRLKRDLSIFQN